MKKIKIAIVGVGNCASALIQGIHYYDSNDAQTIGLMHATIGQYGPADIEVVAAFDIDARKVGKDVSDAVFSNPNCCIKIVKKVPRMASLSEWDQFLTVFHPT